MSSTSHEDLAEALVSSRDKSTSSPADASIPESRRRIKYKSSSASLLKAVDNPDEVSHKEFRASLTSAQSQVSDIINTQRKRLEMNQDYLKTLRREVDEFSAHSNGIDDHEVLQHKIATFSDLVLEMPNELPKLSVEVYIPPNQNTSRKSPALEVHGQSYRKSPQRSPSYAKCEMDAARNDINKKMTPPSSRGSVKSAQGVHLPNISGAESKSSPRHSNTLPTNKVNLDFDERNLATRRKSRDNRGSPPGVVAFNPHPKKHAKRGSSVAQEEPRLSYQSLPMLVTQLQNQVSAEKGKEGAAPECRRELLNSRGGSATNTNRERLHTAIYEDSVRLPHIETSVKSCMSVKKLDNHPTDQSKVYIKSIYDKNKYDREMKAKFLKKSQVDLDSLPTATRLSNYNVLPGIPNKDVGRSPRATTSGTPPSVPLTVKKMQYVDPKMKSREKHHNENASPSYMGKSNTPNKMDVYDDKKKSKRKKDKTSPSTQENAAPCRKFSKYDVLPGISKNAVTEGRKSTTPQDLSAFTVKKMCYFDPPKKSRELNGQSLPSMPTPPPGKKPSTPKVVKHKKSKNNVGVSDKGKHG